MMIDMVPGWMIIVSTAAGMLVSVLAAWAAVKAQIIQPLLASIIEEVIDAMKPDRERWDSAEAAATSNATEIAYIKDAVDTIKDAIDCQDNEVRELRDMQASHMEIGNKRHEKIDHALNAIEKHLAEQDRYHSSP